MPYLEHLYCESCEHPFNLDLDYKATIDAYQQEGRESACVNSATMIWDYMVYSCAKCQRKYRLTFRDVESMVRKYLSSLGAKYEKYLEELSAYNTTEEARRSGNFFKNKDSEIKERVSNLYAED